MPHDDKHSSKHEYGQEDAIVPANIGQYGVAELDSGGQVSSDPKDHASTHEGGTDPITPAGIGAEPAFSKNGAFNKDFGSGAGTVCEGNDARLSDSRTPLAHDIFGALHNSGNKAGLITKLSDVTEIYTNIAGEIHGTTLKSAIVDGDEVLIEDSEATYAKKRTAMSDIKTYMGLSTPEKNSSTGESTTTANTYQSKLQLTFTPPSQHDYQIDFYAEFANEETKQISCKVDLDSGTVMAEQVKKVADTQANGNYEQFCGTFYVNLTAASHTFDLMWHGETAGKTAYIRRAYMIARRV